MVNFTRKCTDAKHPHPHPHTQNTQQLQVANKQLKQSTEKVEKLVTETNWSKKLLREQARKKEKGRKWTTLNVAQTKKNGGLRKSEKQTRKKEQILA